MAFTDRLTATEGTLRARAFFHGTQAFVSHREGVSAPLASVEAMGFKLAANAVHLLRGVVEAPVLSETAEVTEEHFLGMQYADLPQRTAEPVEEILETLRFQYDNGTAN